MCGFKDVKHAEWGLAQRERSGSVSLPYTTLGAP